MLATLMASASAADAHEDPPGCFTTGPAIIVSVFRANGTTGIVGAVSECETINYRARLQKAQDNNDEICAFSMGAFGLTTPDGVVHVINPNVPCIGGTDSAEGCTAALDFIESSLIPYTVDESDIVGGLITATAQYTGGVAHDTAENTPGVAANTPKSTPVGFCNDTNLCTIDTCNPADGQCVHTDPVTSTCNDNNACTDDTCDPATGQCLFTPNDCDDGNACTTDSCDPTTVQCVHTTVLCDDNSACTIDACNPSTGCAFAPITCDDGDPCTTDSCNPLTGCQHTEPYCDLCIDGPRTGCKQSTVPLKAQLRLKDSVDPRADLIQFKWMKGEVTQAADFGRPDIAQAYALCVYGPDVPFPGLVMHLEVPASGVCGTKACWRSLNGKGFLYKDSTGANGGVTKIVLKAGADGKAKAQLTGKGTNLPPLSLPFSLPASVQLQSTNGQCWEAQFSQTGAITNSEAQFKGRADAAP